jgi:hypothetical protein
MVNLYSKLLSEGYSPKEARHQIYKSELLNKKKLSAYEDRISEIRAKGKRDVVDLRDSGFTVEVRKPTEEPLLKKSTKDVLPGYVGDLVVVEEPGFREDPLIVPLHGLNRNDTVPTAEWNERLQNLQLAAEIYDETANLGDPSDTFVADVNYVEAATFDQTLPDDRQNSPLEVFTEAGKEIAKIIEEMAGKITKRRKRSVSTRGRKRASSATKSDKNVIGYLNPFPDLDARIPDGQVVSSLPHRFVNVNEWSISNNNIGHVVLWPGLDAGAMVFATDTSGTLAPDSLFYYKYSGDESYFGGGAQTFSTAPSPQPTAETNLAECIFSAPGIVNKWRLVSQGLRMAMTNPEDTNGGWFETCHLHYKMDMEDWELYSPARNHSGSIDTTTAVSNNFVMTGTEAYIRPLPQIVDDLAPIDKSIAETDGYRCGTLRSIAATTFTLPNFQGNHEFRDFRERYRFEANTTRYTTPSVTGSVTDEDVTIGFTRGHDEAHDFISTSLDTTHDLVYIRIYPGTTSLLDIATKFLVQHVANHEVVYDVNSTLHKHMLPTPAADSKKMDLAKSLKDGQMSPMQMA